MTKNITPLIRAEGWVPAGFEVESKLLKESLEASGLNPNDVLARVTPFDAVFSVLTLDGPAESGLGIQEAVRKVCLGHGPKLPEPNPEPQGMTMEEAAAMVDAVVDMDGAKAVLSRLATAMAKQGMLPQE